MSRQLARRSTAGYTMHMLGHMLGIRVSGLVAILLLASACDFSSTPDEGAPGAIRGTVSYHGAPFACEGDRVQGRLILRLYDHDAPAGGEPARTLAVEGSRLFDASSCGSPSDPDIDAESPFVVSDVGPPPGSREGKTYRLEALWDADMDFDAREPLFNEPTRGDLLGGAFVDPAVAVPLFAPIAFDPPSEHPDGQTINGVSVVVDATVLSERPLFRLSSGTRPLDSEAVVSNAASVIDREREIFELTNTAFELLPLDVEPYRSALDSAGLTLDESAMPRAFWVQPFDEDGDGTADRHPLFGDGLLDDVGRTLKTPSVVFRRFQTDAEERGGLPQIYLYPAPRPTETTVREVFSPSIGITVAPIAVMVLNPDISVCRIPVFAPGNLTDRYEGRPTECQEIPTGRYEMTIRQGVAGGVLSAGVPTTVSDTGFRVTGARFAGQSWSIPNELSDLVNDQGDNGRFLVLDRDTSNDPDASSTDDGHGIEACTTAPDPAMDMMPRAVSYMSLPPACCEPIQHLCGVPLCEADPEGDGFLRQADTVEGDHPSCLPFLMPPSCCR